MAAPSTVARRVETVAFNNGFGPLIRLEAERLEERLEQAERELRIIERNSTHWSVLGEQERLKLRVELHEQREWVDFERYRLERLQEVIRIPWWRVNKRRRVLDELEFAESATTRA